MVENPACLSVILSGNLVLKIVTYKCKIAMSSLCKGKTNNWSKLTIIMFIELFNKHDIVNLESIS